jgi:hypothetical protein
MMVTMTAALAIAPIISGLVPPLGPACQAAAERFIASAGYAQAVLDGQAAGAMVASEAVRPTTSGLVLGMAAAVGAAGLAMASLFQKRLARGLQFFFSLLVRPVLPLLHALHSGDIRDYVAWLALGTAILGGAFLLALR